MIGITFWSFCPLFPRKRTLVQRVGMSALCQTQTVRTATKTAYSITWSAKARTLGEIYRPRAWRS